MRQIRDMSIMEIDITNACGHRCSNCTRFCGHHKKTYFMDFETFKRAVDSLKGFQGLISTIGGEPLLHPEYERFAEYLRQTRDFNYTEMNDGRCKAMVKDYLAFAKAQRWYEGAMNKGKGFLLFTSMPANYYHHYEAVEDTVTDLWLNDHTNPSFHQPILVSRKDLGISDSDFEKMRINCWLENFWSASITPKGCFFCEIAGTLDLLFDGPGGKRIEPGWWNKDLEYFRDQFHWCDICGMALSTYSRNANEEKDDASKTLLKKLESIGSPKLKSGNVYSFDMKYASSECDENIGSDMGSVTANYLPDNNKRVGNAADRLRPENIYLGSVIRNTQEQKTFKQLFDANYKTINGFIVGTYDCFRDDIQKICKSKKDFTGTLKIVLVDESNAKYGAIVGAMLKELQLQDWIIFGENLYKIQSEFINNLKKYFLNPGYLFMIQTENEENVIMFSHLAHTIEKVGRDTFNLCNSTLDIARLWKDKTYFITKDFEQIPDMNIGLFRDRIWENYLRDNVFVQKLKEKLLAQGIKNESNVLLLQSAFVYHTLGIYKILKIIGINVYLMSSEKFRNYFDDILDLNHLQYFSEGAFEYSQQKEIREKLKQKIKFDGAIVPFSFGPSTVKPIDDYTDALRTAEDVGGRILGIINIRREFIEPEYDIWA